MHVLLRKHKQRQELTAVADQRAEHVASKPIYRPLMDEEMNQRGWQELGETALLQAEPDCGPPARHIHRETNVKRRARGEDRPRDDVRNEAYGSTGSKYSTDAT